MTLTTLPLSEPLGPWAFREAGHGAPLVLIHGVGLQSAVWAPQIETLSATHRVIAVDLPGHGGSAPLPSGAELPDFVAWFHAVLSTLGLQRASITGHSMGALVAAGYTATYPAQVSRVAVLNGVYQRSPAARAAVIARAGLILTGSFDLETPLARWFGDSALNQAATQKVAGWLKEVDPSGYATAYSAFARGDETYADKLKNIACPFLAITGADDLNSTAEMARDMALATQNGRAIIIARHRHMVSMTAPDTVSNALKSWLTAPAEQEPA